MNVLHLPLEVGNQVNEICRSLRLSGVNAAGLNWRNVAYIGYGNTLTPTDAFEMAGAWEDIAREYDILHYHTGYTIFPDKSDIRWAIEAGKKVVMHHRGNDVRIPSVARRINPYIYTGSSLPESRMIANLEFYAKHVSTAIVQDFELYDYVSGYYKQVHILPRLVDTSNIKPLSSPPARNVPLVVHAPTSREFKGTDRIIDIVNDLRKEVAFEFALIERTKQTDVLKAMAQADVVIDQILCGAYGNVSVEAMALAKPVVCYVRPDILARMNPAPPIVSAHPDNLYDQLKTLLLNPELRLQLGAQGREFAVQAHDSMKVVRKLMRIYESL